MSSETLRPSSNVGCQKRSGNGQNYQGMDKSRVEKRRQAHIDRNFGIPVDGGIQQGAEAAVGIGFSRQPTVQNITGPGNDKHYPAAENISLPEQYSGKDR